MRDQRRNLNPHKAARAAMWIWGKRYSEQRGGSMDFWDKLDESDKRMARRLVVEIEDAPSEEGTERERIMSGDYSAPMWKAINSSKTVPQLRAALYFVCARLQELEARLSAR